ncbi:MAG: AAA family ATPase [Roseinatronobacter sp.]
MRLSALHLVRYGHFTDARLNFGTSEEGRPDLHVIYGPNEAGKSTVFASWLDLLFGIPVRTGYDFLHDKRTLRIEADISTGHGQLSLARLKGNANTLLDSRSGTPLPEATLAAALGGLERDDYRAMFSLDDDTLESGGESILNSKGDLGKLLFSASAGLADLSVALEMLEVESAAWFKPSGRKFQLKAHKDRLTELTAQRREADLAVSAWRKLVLDVTQAEEAYNSARARREQTQLRLNVLKRDLNALPMLARLRRAEDRLAQLPPPRAIPADWKQALPGWLLEESELDTLIPVAQDTLDRLERAAAEVPDDVAALAHLEQLDNLEGQYGAIEKERADLPRRRAELAEMIATQQTLLARLDRPGIRLDQVTQQSETYARLKSLIEADSVLNDRESAAREELARAQANMPDTPDKPLPDAAALARLGPLITDLRKADLSRALSDATRRQATAQAATRQAFAALTPWQGDACELAGLDLPSADTLSTRAQEMTEATAAVRTARTEVARIETIIARLRATLDIGAPLISPAEVLESRSMRDAAWHRHKDSLSPETASMFETALRADDALVALRLEQTHLAEKHALLRQEEASLKDARAQEAKAEDILALLEATTAQDWGAIGISAEGRTLADLRAWTARRAQALEAQEELNTAQAELDTARARVSAARQTLETTLDLLASPAKSDNFDIQLAEAEALLKMADDLRHRARLRGELKDRIDTLRTIEAARADWRRDWEMLCSGCWIGTPPPDVTEMRRLLEVIADLAPIAPQIAKLLHRIGRIEEDIASFQAKLTGIAESLGEAPGPDPISTWPRLRARLRTAAQNQTEVRRLRKEIEQARAGITDLAARRDRLDAATAQLRAAFPGSTLAAIDQEFGRIRQAQELSEDCTSLRSDLARHLRTETLPDECQRLEGFDPDPARTELETLTATLAAQDEALRAAYAALATAEQARDLANADGTAARLDAKRQTLLLQIADEARQFMARQAGIMAVEQALRLYRDTHRSDMMSRASAAFALLTAGRYQGLTTQPEGRNESLIAQQTGGGSKKVDTLSKGTRFQLYLALRAAGFLELARTRPVVPFIADDIMETFDDTRSEAAFRLLAQMGTVGQVIYLTHHSHLCEIAVRACPEVRLHDLTQIS